MFSDIKHLVKDFHLLLEDMMRQDASDLFFTVGLPPSLKVNGKIVSLAKKSLSDKQVHQLANHMMDAGQRKEFERKLEINFAIAPLDGGRFRVNIFKQKTQLGIVLRRIKMDIPTFAELRIPDKLKELVLTKRGLIIIAGATGAGKSSTLAAMIGYRNQNSSGHIISVEDPIEYIHEHAKCIITQREVGVDTLSFEDALKNTLRQAPDVILIGEVRSRETMEHAINFAETGHLCLTTLHSNNANQALDRIINFFPHDRRDQLLLDLSLNLKAIVGQQLIPTPDRNGHRAAVEILINTPLVAQMIKKGNVAELKDVMGQFNNLGMNTFDQALYELYKDKEISYDDALHHADSANELRLMIKLDKKDGLSELGSTLEGVTLVGVDED